MKWTYRKRFGHWCLTGMYYHTFETWQEGIDYIDTQRHQEPTA